MRALRPAAAVLATMLVTGLSACSSSGPAAPSTTAALATASSRPTPTTTPPTTSPPTAPPTTSAPATTAVSTPPTTSASSHPTKPPPPKTRSLPLGGTKILGHYRIVAYYGGPDGPALGILGSAPPEQIVDAIDERAQEWKGEGLRVQPAMELIATVAQGSAGPDGDWSAPIPQDTIRHYLDVAHAHKMLLILDIQPGQGTFLPQVEALAPFLSDPSVEVALDPEWKMPEGVKPGTQIGSSTSPDILAVRDYLAGIVAKHHLPDKLLMIHQFTNYMLPDRNRITPAKGIEIVFHADGFGTQGAKNATWNALDFPGRPYGTGFKLFTKQDTDMMDPAETLARTPEPDVITYQ